MAIEGSPHAFYPCAGAFASVTLALRGAYLVNRLTATTLVLNDIRDDIREPVGRPLRRISLRAPSSGHADVGASRSRIGLRMSACSIATVAAIGLTALSLMLIGSAAATGSHDTNGAANHSATRPGQLRTDGTDGSSRPSTPDRRNSVEDPAPGMDPSPDPDPS